MRSQSCVNAKEFGKSDTSKHRDASFANESVIYVEQCSRMNQYFFWSSVNIIFFGMILYDLSRVDYVTADVVYYLEVLLALILLCNASHHIMKFLIINTTMVNKLRMIKAPETPKKKSGKEDTDLIVAFCARDRSIYNKTSSSDKFMDFSMKETSVDGKKLTSDDSRLEMTPAKTEEITSFRLSSGREQSFYDFQQAHSSSPKEQSTPKSNNVIENSAAEFTTSKFDSMIPSSQPYKTNSTFHTDTELMGYLRGCEEDLKNADVYFSREPVPSLKDVQFWSPRNENSPVTLDLLKNTVYQTSPISTNDSSIIIEKSTLDVNNELWRRFKVNPLNLVSWITNLRTWIKRTIIDNIISEIVVINNGLKSQGLTTISVGNVGLDTLIRTALNEQISHHVPSLELLIPFLEVSSNQQYVVQRLKELFKGNTLNDFRWKGGGKFNDKEWESNYNLPTDAELIMHLVVTYLDSQLPLLPETPEYRPFSTHYFSKAPKFPEQKDVAIYQYSTYPPHYQLVYNSEIIDLPSGANNVFIAILLFLHCINTGCDGMLGRINMGLSGVNMLWIVQDFFDSEKTSTPEPLLYKS